MEKRCLSSRQALGGVIVFACIAVPLIWVVFLAVMLDCCELWGLRWYSLPAPSAWQQLGSFDTTLAFGSVGRIPLYAMGVIALGTLARFLVRARSRGIDLLMQALLRYVERGRARRRRNGQDMLWTYVGEVVDIRHHCTGLVFRANWFAEVRTTQGTFIVKGRVHESVSSPGLPVSKNGFRQLRIGGLVGTVFKLET